MRNHVAITFAWLVGCTTETAKPPPAPLSACGQAFVGTWNVTDVRASTPNKDPACSLLQKLPPKVETSGATVDAQASSWTEPSDDGAKSVTCALEIHDGDLIPDACIGIVSHQETVGEVTFIVVRTLSFDSASGTLTGTTLATLEKPDTCGVTYDTTATRQ